MAKEARPRLPLVDCSNPECDAKLRQTRPSQTGLHFCKRKPCQAEKQRRYRMGRESTRESEAAKAHEATVTDLVALLQSALHGERRQCPECGLVNALPGWAHPNPVGAACYALGSSRPGGTFASISAVWPPVTRKYADD